MNKLHTATSKFPLQRLYMPVLASIPYCYKQFANYTFCPQIRKKKHYPHLLTHF